LDIVIAASCCVNGGSVARAQERLKTGMLQEGDPIQMRCLARYARSLLPQTGYEVRKYVDRNPRFGDSRSVAEEEMRKTPSQRVFSVRQVAAMCQVSNETIRRWIRKHGLVAYNTTGGLAIKIPEADLRAFAERLRVYVDWEALDEDE
jgi:excisionase family DNA binding protein